MGNPNIVIFCLLKHSAISSPVISDRCCAFYTVVCLLKLYKVPMKKLYRSSVELSTGMVIGQQYDVKILKNPLKVYLQNVLHL